MPLQKGNQLGSLARQDRSLPTCCCTISLALPSMLDIFSAPNYHDLTGAVGVVSGGGTGIGLMAATALASCGATVCKSASLLLAGCGDLC